MPVVSGHVTEVAVANNDLVMAGQPLFQMQSDRYELARQAAQAALYLLIGEFSELAPALYFSVVTYTTLGYGDLTLGADWQVSSGVEAANGILLFGVSTAVLLSALRRVIQDSLMKDPEREAQS